MVQIHPVAAFADNYLWVIEDGRHAAVVDPGDDEPVQAFLEERGLTLTVPTVLAEETLLRFCFINPQTTDADIGAVLDSLV